MPGAAKLAEAASVTTLVMGDQLPWPEDASVAEHGHRLRLGDADAHVEAAAPAPERRDPSERPRVDLAARLDVKYLVPPEDRSSEEAGDEHCERQPVAHRQQRVIPIRITNWLSNRLSERLRLSVDFWLALPSRSCEFWHTSTAVEPGLDRISM